MTNYRHGHTRRDRNGKVFKTLTYRSWSAMNERCGNEGHKWYHRYGGRGIMVCERWRRGTPHAFANFLTDMGERPNVTMTLDRREVNGNYEPTNCRWATKSMQRQNQSTEGADDELDVPF